MSKVHPVVYWQRAEYDRYRLRTQHHHNLLSKIQRRNLQTFRFSGVLRVSDLPTIMHATNGDLVGVAGRTTSLAAGGSTHIRFWKQLRVESTPL